MQFILIEGARNALIGYYDRKFMSAIFSLANKIARAHTLDPRAYTRNVCTNSPSFTVSYRGRPYSQTVHLEALDEPAVSVLAIAFIQCFYTDYFAKSGNV